MCCLHVKPFFLPNDAAVVHYLLVSVLILRPREIPGTNYQIMWSQPVCETEKTKTTALNQGKASEMLAYRVREHNKTSQAMKNKKNKN